MLGWDVSPARVLSWQLEAWVQVQLEVQVPPGGSSITRTLLSGHLIRPGLGLVLASGVVQCIDRSHESLWQQLSWQLQLAPQASARPKV